MLIKGGEKTMQHMSSSREHCTGQDKEINRGVCGLLFIILMGDSTTENAVLQFLTI
jgi:hypothetical protein